MLENYAQRRKKSIPDLLRIGSVDDANVCVACILVANGDHKKKIDFAAYPCTFGCVGNSSVATVAQACAQCPRHHPAVKPSPPQRRPVEATASPRHTPAAEPPLDPAHAVKKVTGRDPIATVLVTATYAGVVSFVVRTAMPRVAAHGWDPWEHIARVARPDTVAGVSHMTGRAVGYVLRMSIAGIGSLLYELIRNTPVESFIHTLSAGGKAVTCYVACSLFALSGVWVLCKFSSTVVGPKRTLLTLTAVAATFEIYATPIFSPSFWHEIAWSTSATLDKIEADVGVRLSDSDVPRDRADAVYAHASDMCHDAYSHILRVMNERLGEQFNSPPKSFTSPALFDTIVRHTDIDQFLTGVGRALRSATRCVGSVCRETGAHHTPSQAEHRYEQAVFMERGMMNILRLWSQMLDGCVEYVAVDSGLLRGDAAALMATPPVYGDGTGTIDSVRFVYAAYYWIGVASRMSAAELDTVALARGGVPRAPLNPRPSVSGDFVNDAASTALSLVDVSDGITLGGRSVDSPPDDALCRNFGVWCATTQVRPAPLRLADTTDHLGADVVHATQAALPSSVGVLIVSILGLVGAVRAAGRR